MEAAASASIVEDLMESWPLTVPVLAARAPLAFPEQGLHSFRTELVSRGRCNRNSVRTILVSLQDHWPRPYNSGQ